MKECVIMLNVRKKDIVKYDDLLWEVVDIIIPGVVIKNATGQRVVPNTQAKKLKVISHNNERRKQKKGEDGVGELLLSSLAKEASKIPADFKVSKSQVSTGESPIMRIELGDTYMNMFVPKQLISRYCRSVADYEKNGIYEFQFTDLKEMPTYRAILLDAGYILVSGKRFLEDVVEEMEEKYKWQE